jgi:ATP-dependent Clp protease ATP-binding subunit ClpB
MEDLSLRQESDAASKERLGRLEEELLELRNQQASLNEQWQKEKSAINQVQSIKEEIERVQHQIDQAKRNYDLNKAAELEYGTLDTLIKQLSEKEIALNKVNDKSGNSLLREEVMEEDIAEVISKWTSIPITKLVQSEIEKILNLEEVLHKRVIGQDKAVTSVAEAIQRSKAGMSDPNRPIASFIFLGPTGVGKTELSKTLAANLFDNEESIIRIDMSEYMEKHTVSRLIGASPGYIGYEAGGQLSEVVRRNPYSVILFDEIEKAHSDVLNLMLQILDDGRLTDSQGRTINFTNTIIILTSNIGSDYIKEISMDETEREKLNDLIMFSVKEHFKPEFLNRIDESIIFHGLSKKELIQIVGIQIKELSKRLKSKGLELVVSEKGMEWIVDNGFDPTYGARPIKRTIQREIETPIAKAILRGNYSEGKIINVEVKGDVLSFS